MGHAGVVLGQSGTKMRIQILPEDGADGGGEASEVLGRLREAVAVGQDGLSAVDRFSLLSDIRPETLTATMATDKDHAAVDVYSESAFSAVAHDDFKVTAGGKFDGRVQDTADFIVGGLDLQSLKKVSLTGGDHAVVSVHGDIGTTASGSVKLNSAALAAHVTSDTGITAGGNLNLAAGGHATVGAKSLLAQMRGDIDATGAALKLSGTKELSVVAGDIDVQTPGAVKIAGKGGVAELGGEPTIDYVGVVWNSPANFGFFEYMLPETVSGVTEMVVRASYAGSPAEIVATVPTTLTMEVGTAAADGSLSYTKVWSSAVGVGTFSLDGLVVSVASAVDVSTIKLSATSDGVYSGWSMVDFKLGVETAAGMAVASAGDIEATAGKAVLLNAGSVSLSSSTDLDVSASASARLASKDVSVLASGSLAAAADSLDMQVSDTFEAFSGGEAAGSFGSVNAESRGPASLTAAGDVSVAAESATVAVSGDLGATAANVKLNTESLESMTQYLTATAAESASLYAADASISAAGTLSAYMGSADIIAEDSLSMQSAGDVGVRARGAVVLESLDSTTLRSGSLSTTTGSLKVRAGGGTGTTTATVELECEGECQESRFRAEMAELLGVPVSRLRVSAEAADTDSSGRRRMQDDDGTRTGASKPRKTSRALSLWSVKELEKYVRSVLGLAAVAGEINRQRVDGAMAVEMSKGEWKDMGATGLEAARIVSALKKFAGAQRSR